MSWNEEEAAGVLRAHLREIDIPPTRLTATDAVRNGRRSQARWQVGAAVAVIAVVGAIGIPAAIAVGGGGRTATVAEPVFTFVDGQTRPTGKARCTTTAIARPAGFKSGPQITHADPAGRFYLGGGDLTTGGYQAVIWRDGVPSRLDVPAGGVASGGEAAPELTGVNSSGVVIGSKQPPGAFGYVFQDGKAERLGVPAGYAVARPAAINDRGDVLGVLQRNEAGGHPDLLVGDQAVALWPAGALDSPRVLQAAAPASAVGFTADGQAVGNVQNIARPDGDKLSLNGAATTPYIWSRNGEGKPLPLPAGWAGAKVRAVGGDHVLGIAAQTVDADPRVVHWNVRTGKTEILKAPARNPVAVNALGWSLRAESDRTGGPMTLVAPDGTAGALPMPDASLMDGVAIGPDGRTVVGNLFFDIAAGEPQLDPQPHLWRCR